ncbi:hypothetical protein GWK47_043280 [Chionoecetes opilio]|uniref:Uncharacterized protein n=1 Tax=Chionoecetes opilio TaxID=41210 RepID=A0A8J4Y7Y4_CHIOP|nr:hypothetical protein GWK47_043280 [Chionoecetes opilio]
MADMQRLLNQETESQQNLIQRETELEKHEYGRTLKRKRALEGFQEYDVLQAPTSDPSQQHRGLMTDFKKIKEDNHDAGILQVLDSSTTSASENDVPRPSTTAITLTPDERVQQLLQMGFTHLTGFWAFQDADIIYSFFIRFITRDDGWLLLPSSHIGIHAM